MKTLALTAAKREPDTIQVLPMNLRIGDTFTDNAGTLEVVERATTERGGKGVRAKVQSPGELWTRREHWWPAHEKVTVTRRAAP